ncbi:SusC/RagA family TonB-linked outer membrane protein [Sphingobacterium olei]|uniref:SusC/RagA family TonB-linked outer membrane protein n=1 Tax=Sphingobacterium olei TaxID=2571155 RepID=A0A4V5MNM1_9SPHI|nr:SusC/RagA family TonB-linked outer membrane protein [Sphingobacterium olei]TJZ62008.1 SusC/RagA family TonB-linked outer membrane protein [Sphingobacterium olei]
MRKVTLNKFCGLIFALCWLFQIGFAQQRTVSGRVVDENGQSLEGVTVSVRGSAVSTQTDNEGRYAIRVPGTTSALVFRSVGMKAHEASAGSSATLDVVLEASSAGLDEVVVTAFGIARSQRSLGYAAQSVNSEDLTYNRQPNLLNALQGKVAGVTISSTGGGPGQGANLRIRGVNSIDPNIPSDPLYIIDGVQIDNSTSTLGAGGSGSGARGVTNRVSDLNPQDIESVNILKGGAATALYGLRGSNGVVVITTKKGKTGGFSVNFSSTYGFDQVLRKPAVQTTYTQGVLGIYTHPATGIGPAWGPTIAEAKEIDPTHPDKLFNNFDRAFRTGQQTNNSLSVSGGNDVVRVFSSVSHFFQQGMMPNTDYNNFSGRLNTDFTISPKFKTMVNMSFSNAGGYTYSSDRFGEGLAYWSPRYDVRDYLNEDGTQNWIGTNNPIYGTATNKLKGVTNRYIGGATLTYDPASWLNIMYRFGLDTYSDNRLRTAPGPMGIPGERTYDNQLGFVGEYNTTFRSLNSTFVASLNTNFTDDLKGTLRLGHEVFDRRVNEVGVLGSELTIYNFFRLGNAAVLSTAHNAREYRLMGFFGEATLDYKNYLYLTLTGRTDVTSTLSKENRSFFYPSASLSYVFADHVPLPSVISNGRLRLSYARIGKDASEYAISSGFGTYSSLPAGYTGLTLSSNLGNPGLRPEFTDTYEAGLEMGWFNNRLGLDFTYYYSLSKDQIVRQQITPATGYVTTSVNAGDMRNRGVELVINGKPITNKVFTWDANINVSANRNKILSLESPITYGSARGYGNAAVTQILMEGEQYGNIYGSYFLRYTGDQPHDEEFLDRSLPLLIGADGFPQLSGSRQKVLGNSQPDWILGLGNTFTYKEFSLNALFDARLGFDRYNWLENFYTAFGMPDYTVDRNETKIIDGVLADGTPNTKEVWLGQKMGPDGVDYGEGYYRRFYRNVSEPFVTDASWVRLRSASLTYNLPSAWLPKRGLRSAAFTVTGNNLWLWTKYYGVDPESSSYESGSNVDSSAGFTYPTARSIMFTLSVGL